MKRLRKVNRKEEGTEGKKPFYKKRWFKALAVIFVINLMTTKESSGVEKEDKDLGEEIVNVEEESAKDGVGDEEKSVDEEEPVEESVDEAVEEDSIESIIEDFYGDKFIEVEYIELSNHYNVYTKTSEGISPKWDRKGTYHDTTELLNRIKDKDFDSIYIEYKTSFSDKYGNSEYRKGITYDFTKDTVDKINFDKFLPKNLPEVADGYWQHVGYE